MKFFSKNFGIFDVIVIIFLISIFNHLTYVVTTDIPLHAQFIKSYTDGNMPFQVNFLYYYTVYAISFHSNNLSILLFVSIYVLAFITFYKYNFRLFYPKKTYKSYYLETMIHCFLAQITITLIFIT